MRVFGVFFVAYHCPQWYTLHSAIAMHMAKPDITNNKKTDALSYTNCLFDELDNRISTPMPITMRGQRLKITE